MRRSQVSAVVACLIEGSCLAALVVVPLFFDPHTVRTFDADKILLLRSIAVVILVGLVVWTIEAGGDACTRNARALWRTPIVAGMLLLTGAYGVSTVASIAPRIAFWGSYFRCQGTLTWLSYVTVFCAIVLLIRRRAQVDRLVTMALLASFPPAVYGLIQHLGRDPIDWQLSAAAQDRVGSTLGNPIFVSGFLIMVVPLTLARLIERCAALAGRPVDGGPLRHPWRDACLASTYLLLLALQVLTIAYSQSRGPVIGLIAGLAVFFMVCWVRYRMRWMTVTLTAVAALGVLCLVAFAGPRSRFEQLEGIRSPMDQGTAKVRVVIWQGVADLLAARPFRAIAGYGPDTLGLAFEPFYPPELAHYEGRIVTPDRAHNETFDALVMTGILGCTAEIVLFLSLFYCILHWLGMAERLAQRRALVAAMGLGGIVGGVTPYIVDGSVRFSGVGLPAGIVIGVILYLGFCLFRRSGASDDQERSHGLVLVALLAAAVAHFVELQVGIATAATRLYLAAFAGLAVAIGMGLSADEDAGELRRPGWLPTASAFLYAAIVGLMLVVLTYEFSVPSLRPAAPGFVLLWLFLGTWVCGLVLLTADCPLADEIPPHRLANVMCYAFISLGLWAVFAGVHLAWLDWKPVSVEAAERVHGIAGHIAGTVSILYVFVFCIIGFGSLLGCRRDPSPAATFARRPRWLWVVYLVLFSGAVPVVVVTNLDGARADTFAKLGSSFERDGKLNAARVVYEEAQRLQPTEETYDTSLGRVLMEQARATPRETAERTAYLREALAAARRAQRDNPANPLRARNLARVHRLWASGATDPAEQAQHFERAESYYKEAVQRAPHNAALWKEWATLYLEWHQPAKALPKLDESIRLDDAADTRALRAGTENLIEQQKAKP